MKIKIEYCKWFDNKPIVTRFEGTIEEFKELVNLQFIVKQNEK